MCPLLWPRLVTIGAHRKVVTVLSCDVGGSTGLGESVDPEALQGLLAALQPV